MLTEFLRSGQVGNIELNAQKQIRESVTKRWEQLGFVDGLEGQLKEKKGGKWSFFKKWKSRYFTLSGAKLTYKETVSDLILKDFGIVASI